MKRNILRSIWAIIAGFSFVVILSVFSDLILGKTGAMKQPFDTNPVAFIILVILYRSMYSVIGSYLTAWIAPNRPMGHALTGGA